MLKLDPGNPDLRQRTLGYGRTYSALMREENKSTIFDEMALMNDINAACAATQQVTAPVAPESTLSRTTDDLEERFLKLQGLKDKGLIDEEAYNKRKSELLAQI